MGASWRLGALLTLGLVAGCASSFADDFAAKAKATNRPQSFNRAGYKPKAGDRATLQARSDMAVSVDFSSHERYWKAVVANDDVGIKELYDARKVMLCKPGTEVLVIKIHDFGGASDGPPCAEVRIMDVDGPHKNEVVWVSCGRLSQMVRFPLEVGQEGYLDGSVFPNGEIPVASSREAYNLFGSAWNERDFALITGLEVTKQLVSVREGTRIKVRAICIADQFREDFKLKHMGVNVEFLSGPLKGKTAWVLPDTIKKPAPAEDPKRAKK
jgi:hypothetical protein